MKKWVLSGVMLITSFLSFAAFAGSPYGHCPITDSNNAFCKCFYSSCSKVFGSGQCQYSRLVSYFNSRGVNAVCSAYGHGTNQQECVEGIQHFIQVCH